ncbi:MAG: DUF418 domain-containing protein [Pseudomonadota bacterium]|nr:DUF418 domain-containing protein [Pseudomonadota bacterium]
MQYSLAEQTQRIRILDIIRGVAVLGIVTMNIPDMAYPEDLVLDFHATDPGKGWNYWIGVVSEILFAGKMRGLFTLLFGVSSILIFEKLTRNIDGLAAADIYFRRLLWLLIFGLVNAYLFLWWGDVLFKYALLGMLLFSFRRASYRVLTSVVLICFAVLTIQPTAEYREMVNLQQRYIGVQNKQKSAQPLTSDEQEVIVRWQESLDDMRPDSESIEDECQVKADHYFEIFKYNARQVLEEQTTIFYREDVWDMSLYMFLGIILLRMGLFNERVKQSIHLTIAFFGIGIGLAVHAWLNLGLYKHYLDPTHSEYYLIFINLGRLPFVLGYLSLIIFLFRTEALNCIGDWMVAAGRMALSNYMIQSIIGAFVFYGFGLALFNQLTRLDIALVIVLVWIFQIIFSVIWMKLFYYGPFEWLWRSLTYWRAQPLRKK